MTHPAHGHGLMVYNSILALLSVLNPTSICPQVDYPGKEVGLVTDPSVDEASGLAASQINHDVFCTLNDSDGPSCVYALAINGTLLYTLCLEGALNFDWEAVSIAPCDSKYVILNSNVFYIPAQLMVSRITNTDFRILMNFFNCRDSDVFCIFIGDIGDNSHKRDVINVFRVLEPHIDSKTTKKEETNSWQVFNFRYGGKKVFNAESMLIDPDTRELVIVTKSPIPPYAYVFKTALDIEPNTVGILEDTGIKLMLPDATDAAISTDGQVIIVRLYFGAFLWPRRPRHSSKSSIVDILREEECIVSVGIQQQGESVALNDLGTSYFTHSEHVNQSIWQYDILSY